MAQKRLSMPNVREVVRLEYELGRSYQKIAAALGIGARADACAPAIPFPHGRAFTPPPPLLGPRSEPVAHSQGSNAADGDCTSPR